MCPVTWFLFHLLSSELGEEEEDDEDDEERERGGRGSGEERPEATT